MCLKYLFSIDFVTVAVQNKLFGCEKNLVISMQTQLVDNSVMLFLKALKHEMCNKGKLHQNKEHTLNNNT